MTGTITGDMLGRVPTRTLAKEFGGKLENGNITQVPLPIVNAFKSAIQASSKKQTENTTASFYAKTAKTVKEAHEKITDAAERKTYSSAISSLIKNFFSTPETSPPPKGITHFIPKLNTTKSKILFASSLALASFALYYGMNGSLGIDTKLFNQLNQNNTELSEQFKACSHSLANATSQLSEAIQSSNKAANQTKGLYAILNAVCENPSHLKSGCQENPVFSTVLKKFMKTN